MSKDRQRDATGRFVRQPGADAKSAADGAAEAAGAKRKPAARKPAARGQGAAAGERALVARQRSGAGYGAQVRKPSKRAFSPEKQERYFASLAATANGALSARVAGVCEQTVANWRKANAAFAARWRDTLAQGYADLEMQMLAQARFGLTQDSSAHTDEDGVRHRHVRRDSGQVGLRLLAMNQARAMAAELTEAAEAELIGHHESEALVERITIALASVRLLSDQDVADAIAAKDAAFDEDSGADAGDAPGPVEVKGLVQRAAGVAAAAPWRALSLALLTGGARLARLRDAARATPRDPAGAVQRHA